MKNFGFAILGAMCAFLLACSDSDSSTEGGDVVITDKTISGVSQKGPFVKGSSVTVYELGAQSLSQTGKSYDGKIKNERGEFTVEVEKLESPYVLLKADGYYRNEITGEKSNGTVTLYAMTDLSNRSEVNVNLLTHLEYERSRYLVKNKKMSVADAKKQAEKEVLESFGIEGKFENSENLNIFGDDAGSAALLAISVLMQGNLKEADFTERLNDYASDIEDDGKWDDKKTATMIADWAASAALGSIRQNITDWELSSAVPAFEKFVDEYWWNSYGLGVCSDKREGEVVQNSNAQSRTYNKYFICKENVWYFASEFEYDTYKWKDGKDGEIRKGQINKEVYYVYDASKNAWNVADTMSYDIYDYKNSKKIECNEFGKIVHGAVNTDIVYFCYGKEWKKFYGNESVSYGKLVDERDGQIYRTVKIGNQTWMAENLGYADEEKYSSMGNGRFWCSQERFGCVYSWSATIDSVYWSKSGKNCGYFSDFPCGLPEKVRGVCPSGWHVPNDEEWETLKGQGKSTDLFAKGTMANDEITDKFGFEAYPLKKIGVEDYYANDQTACFWSSSEYNSKHDSSIGIAFILRVEDSQLEWYERNQFASVRCVKDEDE